MKLKKLTLKNIRSYKSQEIEFPEGSILLSGDIGSGKTSILLAIEYALFGLQPGQRGSSLLSANEDDAEVNLEFEIDGKSFFIERKLRRGSKTVTQDYAALTSYGVKEEISTTELKTKILKLLQYPEEFIKKTNLLYRYTVYSPQEEMKQIILEDPESRLNILRHVFGIDKYKKIKENLIILGSKLRERSRLLQAELRDIDLEKESLLFMKENLKNLEEKTTKLKKILEEKTKKRIQTEKELEKINEKIKKKEEFQNEIEKTNIILKNKSLYISESEKSLTELKNKIAETTVVFDQKEYDSLSEKINDKTEKIDIINGKIIDFSGRVNSINLIKTENIEKKDRIFKIDICPTCLQNVSENHKHNILNDAESKLAKFKEEHFLLSEKLKELNDELSKEKNELSLLSEKKSNLEVLKYKTENLKSAEEEKEKLQKNIESLKKDEESLKSHLAVLKKSVLELSGFDSLHLSKNNELKISLKDEKDSEIELAELRKEKEMTEKNIEILIKKLEEKEKLREKMHKIIETEKWLSNDFSNLVSFTEKNILIKLREDFSNSFNNWFTLLTSEDFTSHLDETFTPIIMRRGYELDYSYLSGGERTAVALAYRLALNQIINSVLSHIKTKDIIILDEPTDGFSEQQLGKVRDILQELKAEQLILVSHEQKIEGFVDRVIKLKKENGISSIINHESVRN